MDMFYYLFNLIILYTCIGGILCGDDPHLENHLSSQFSNRSTSPVVISFSNDSRNIELNVQNKSANDKEMETFYQKISQQLQNCENQSSSIARSASQSQSTAELKSPEAGMKNLVKTTVSRTSLDRTNPLYSHLSTKKTKNSKTNNHLPNHKIVNRFRHFARGAPSTRGMPRSSLTKNTGDVHIYRNNYRLRRDTQFVEKRLPRQKGGLRQKTNDDKRSFHFRLILRNNSTARRPNPRLEKLKHPVNLHVLRKRAAIADTSAAKHNMDREKRIYLEHNEILDDDLDPFTKDQMWSSELAKDKLNLYEKKFSIGYFGKLANTSKGGERRDAINEEKYQNNVNFGIASSAENVDQSNEEKCGNPKIFNYRYYWCRAKNVFKNFVKLFKWK